MLDPSQLLWTRVAAGVCAVLAGLFVAGLVRQRGRLKTAESWSKIEGEIVASEVDQPASHVSDDLNDATPIIRYRYRVGGKDFQGDQIRIGGHPLTTRILAMRLTARYPVGARVDVNVDPDDPARSVLEPPTAGSLVAQSAITVVFCVIAAVLVAHALAGEVIKTANGVPLFAFALPLVAFVVALAGLLAYARGRRLAAAGARWPTAPGTITASSVIEEKIKETRNDDDRSFVRTVLRYQIDLRYAYKVGARDFVGTVVGFGWEAVYGLRDVAEKAAARYAPGQRVSVYYDPALPSNAVLEPDNRAGTLAPLVVAVLFAVTGALFLLLFMKADFR